jgi:hypothetical protein
MLLVSLTDVVDVQLVMAAWIAAALSPPFFLYVSQAWWAWATSQLEEIKDKVAYQYQTIMEFRKLVI